MCKCKTCKFRYLNPAGWYMCTIHSAYLHISFTENCEYFKEGTKNAEKKRR